MPNTLAATMDFLKKPNHTRQSQKCTVHECNTDRKKTSSASPCNGRDCFQELQENFFSDCSGNVYRRVRMRGNGFCGFNSLSYCLTGTQQNYEQIIDDCIKVFEVLPDLFRMRTNFGGKFDSSLRLVSRARFLVRRGAFLWDCSVVRHCDFQLFDGYT